MKQVWQVGILLFNEVEVLDFAGPFEVFSLAEWEDKKKLCSVHTIAEKKQLIKARNGLLVMPEYDFTDVPDLDILIIPGGYGAEEIELKNETVLAFLRQKRKEVSILASVCTGAFLLAEAGLLDGKRATTHWMDCDRLEQDYKKVTVLRNQKYIEDGDLITAGGISAGIHMSFHILERLAGTDIVHATAKRMEFDL